MNLAISLASDTKLKTYAKTNLSVVGLLCSSTKIEKTSLQRLSYDKSEISKFDQDSLDLKAQTRIESGLSEWSTMQFQVSIMVFFWSCNSVKPGHAFSGE